MRKPFLLKTIYNIFFPWMKVGLIVLFLICCVQHNEAQVLIKSSPVTGYEERLKGYIDTIRALDNHEHLLNPEYFKNADFTLLLQRFTYDDLLSVGMPDSYFDKFYKGSLTPSAKWELIEPYWNKIFNTTNARILLLAINDLYGISSLNSASVELITQKMRKAYAGDWFKHILTDICRFDYVIQEGDSISKFEFIPNAKFVRYTYTFHNWLTIRQKSVIDLIAMAQVEPIYTLEDFVKSMRSVFEAQLKTGIVAAKIDIAYSRTLFVEDESVVNARKVFRTLITGNEDFTLSPEEAKPLQDYMIHQLIKIAQQNKIPVAIHTGMQAGFDNNINNSDPTLLVSLFRKYPDVRFVLYHGSYPFGGELSTLARGYKNVYVDMNWTFAISPDYASRNLSELLETVPVSKIMAFGGDQRCSENTYGSFVIAKQVISNVLIEKVRNGLLTESEAKVVAKMLLHDNGMKFYNLR